MKLTKQEQKKVAKSRMRDLFVLADTAFVSNKTKSNRYISLALKLRERYKLKLTKAQKMKFCKKCKKYLKPGKNCTVRTKKKFIMYHCEDCGYHNRIMGYNQYAKVKRQH